MQKADLLIEARWILPIEPGGTVLEHHALAVRDGRIEALLPAEAARSRFTPEQHLRLPEHVLMPGLVNAHTHAAMSLMRGLADDLPLMDWLQHHVWPTEARFVDEDFVRDGTRLALAEMLRSGTTCFNDMYFFPEVTAQVASEVGLRAAIGLILIDFPTRYAEGPEDYLHKALQTHETWRNDPLVHLLFAPHAPYSVSNAPLQRLRTLADELGLPIHMHVHETAQEIQASLETHGCRPLERLDRLGFLGPDLVAVHMTQLTDAEIEKVAATGVQVVHCPESNLKLASGFCPVQRLLEAGVNLALGTDGAASNNDLDLLGETRTAALLAKGVAGDPTAMDAHTALEAATLNGARALGLEKETGSLVPGKWADLCAIRLDAVETTPLYDVASHLVYAAGREQVTDVWVAGRHLMHERRLLTLDEEAVLATARRWQQRIAAGERR
ncbi:MAG: TRZ/ATZ family hydrolase [Gammaproteobacteria bacterium]|nr:MAG: TRZ/ATZ family hydrolase [Gammaproteobacteria bacterium]